ncbi:MAG TPA: hypothetical protein DCG30_01285 [Ruminococcus sp.]|nr:hypothetical protein [Ruminococcus sp.]
MKWLDGRELPENITADTLFELLYGAVDEYPIEKWKTVNVLYPKECYNPLYVSLWILYFDSLLAKFEIYECIRNPYIVEIIDSFRIIGDNADAEILDKLKSIFPPDVILFPGGKEMLYNLYKFPTDKDYTEGRILAQKLFQQGDIQTLVKSYLRRRLHWKKLDTALTYDNHGNLICREEEYKTCRISLKLCRSSCFLVCCTENMCHTIPCDFSKNSTELFEKIQDEFENFIDSEPTTTEKEIFYKNFILKYKL